MTRPACGRWPTAARSELGHIDVVVANAGILNWAKTHELTEAQWQDVIDVNLTGVYNTVEATLPHLLKQGTGGSIIVTSSSAGLKGQPFTLSYTAAKHGIVGIVNAIAIEYGDYNIRANSIHPCGVRTDMGDAPGLMELINERASTIGPTFMNTLPVDFVEPEDISATVAYLASDDAKYVTGVQLKVDAGLVGRSAPPGSAGGRRRTGSGVHPSNSSWTRASSGSACRPPPTMIGCRNRWTSSTRPARKAWPASVGAADREVAAPTTP